MKLILSSCDFLNEKSRQVIYDNIGKDLKECKVLFIPNEKATKELIYSDKYYKRLFNDGFTNRENIYIFDEERNLEFCNLDLDIIYIGGGNTFATLKKLKDSKFDKEIINYIKKGVIYIGGSCGAHIVSNNIKHLEGFDDNYCNLDDYNALNILDAIIIPHFNEENYNPIKRNELYNRLLKENKHKIYTLTNSESLVIIDNLIQKNKNLHK